LATARAAQTGPGGGRGDRLDGVTIHTPSGLSLRGWPSAAEDGDFAILYATATQLSDVRDMAGVAELVIDRAKLLLKSDLAFVALRDPHDKVLHMVACVGHRTEEFMGFARPVEQGIAVYEMRPMYSADFLNDNRLSHHPDTDARIRAEGIRSVLVVPLTGRDSVVGMLAVANRSVHSFTEREVFVMTELGRQAAGALDNARVYTTALADAAAANDERDKTVRALHEFGLERDLNVEMVDGLLAGEGMGAVLGTLEKAFGVAVIATDWRNAVLGHRGGSRWIANGQIARALLERSQAEGVEREEPAGDRVRWQGGTLVIPIATADENLGYLWLPGADKVQQPSLVGAATTGAKLLALELLRERVAVETERRLGRDLLLNLLGETPADPATLETLARQVWRHYGAAHRPVTIRVGPEQPTPNSHLERVRRYIADSRPGDLVAVHRGQIVLMLGETDRERASKEIGRIRTVVSGTGLELSCVVGTVCRDLRQDRACILSCLHLHELLGLRPAAWLEELEPLTILFAAYDRDRLDRFIQSVLGPIANRGELLATLHAYYVSGRNRSRAARQLNVHVNTLRYRLERIESALGQSIDDPAKEAAIQLAVAVQGGHATATA
jgi:PucR-like helix-turn-helix protein/GAF domain-containing protein/diguanylate cyclase with GGDEF domain